MYKNMHVKFWTMTQLLYTTTVNFKSNNQDLIEKQTWLNSRGLTKVLTVKELQPFNTQSSNFIG